MEKELLRKDTEEEQAEEKPGKNLGTVWCYGNQEEKAPQGVLVRLD